MFLGIDIGNTNIILGIFQDEVLKATWRITTGLHRLSDEYATLMLSLFAHKGINPEQIKDAALCSVVPPLTAIFTEVCNRYLGLSPLVIRAGVKTGVRIRLANPGEVGADRIVNAAAAHHLYGGPLIVIDLGTATTFDAVSEEGDYLGGAIAPGIAIAVEALSLRAAALPRVELIPPRQAIGKDTITAMQSGIIFGYVGLIEGIIARFRRELGEAKVVATGGYCQLLASETSSIQIVNPDLTLLGVRLIYEVNKSRGT